MATRAAAVNSEIGSVFLVKIFSIISFFVDTPRKMAIVG